MLLASVIKTASLLLVQWCLLLPTPFIVSDVAVQQAHNANPVTTDYLLDLTYYHSLVVTCFLSVSPYSNVVHCSVQLTQLFICQLLHFMILLVICCYYFTSFVCCMASCLHGLVCIVEQSIQVSYFLEAKNLHSAEHTVQNFSNLCLCSSLMSLLYQPWPD